MPRIPNPLRSRAWVAGAAAALAGACAHRADSFVWVDQAPAEAVAPPAGEYQLRPGDLVNIQVFGHSEMTGRTRVRDDGKLSVPLLGDVPASGRSPGQLGQAVEQALVAGRLVTGATRVTVALEERAPVRVSVLGEVARPGLFVLDQSAGVAEALASAGGFTDFAHRDRIYVVRRDPVMRMRLRYADLARARGSAALLRLRSGDVVVVE